MSTVFLGGTVGNNPWRDDLIADLGERGVDASDLFNPVVAKWTGEAQENEERHKVEDDYMLFYLADPRQSGNLLSAYSMVEATMALYDRPESTVVVFDPESMSGHARKAFNQTEKILRTRFPNAEILSSYDELLEWLASIL